jgi:hypothetical protein
MIEVVNESRRSFFPTGRRDVGLVEGSGSSRSFVGGMRLMLFNATWPLVRLKLLEEGLRLESSIRVLRWLVPVWEIRFDDVSEVQAVGRIPLFTTGIRIRARSTNECIIFWSVNRASVLDALSAIGLPVNSRPIRIRYWNPGR